MLKMVEEQKDLIYHKIISKNHVNISDLFKDINDILETDDSSFQKATKRQDEVLKKFSLLQKLYNVKNTYVDVNINVDNKFDVIKIDFKKSFGNSHQIILKCTPSGDFDVCQHTLPECDQLPNRFSDIHHAVAAFKECLLDLSDYFDTMADIDECCWVIDPVLPTSKDNFRRIVIGDNVSLLVTIDYKNSREMPHMNVLSSSSIVESLSKKIHENSERWDSSLNITINLLNILDLFEFPKKPTDTQSSSTNIQTDIECGICFSVRDDTETLPDISCENTRCSQHFHVACLFQWLSAVSTNIQTFDTIHGECPGCQTPISCAVVDLA